MPIPLDGIGLGVAGNSSTEYGYTQNLYHVRTESKIPLLKVLESLENFFQEVFKQGLGQRPKVLSNITRNGTTCVSFRISQQLTSYHFYPVAEKA